MRRGNLHKFLIVRYSVLRHPAHVYDNGVSPSLPA